MKITFKKTSECDYIVFAEKQEIGVAKKTVNTNRYNASGCRLAKVYYTANIDDEELFEYTKKDLINLITIYLTRKNK